MPAAAVASEYLKLFVTFLEPIFQGRSIVFFFYKVLDLPFFYSQRVIVRHYIRHACIMIGWYLRVFLNFLLAQTPPH